MQDYIIYLQHILDSDLVCAENLKTMHEDIKGTELAKYIAWYSQFPDSLVHFPAFDGEFGVKMDCSTIPFRDSFLPSKDNSYMDVLDKVSYADTNRICSTQLTRSNPLQVKLEAICDYFLNDNFHVYEQRCARLMHFHELLAHLANADTTNARKCIKDGKSKFGGLYLKVPYVGKLKVNPLGSERYKTLLDDILSNDTLTPKNIESLRDNINGSILGNHISFYFENSIFDVEISPKWNSREYQLKRGYLINQHDSKKEHKKQFKIFEEGVEKFIKHKDKSKPRKKSIRKGGLFEKQTERKASFAQKPLYYIGTAALSGIGIYCAYSLLSLFINYVSSYNINVDASSTLSASLNGR